MQLDNYWKAPANFWFLATESNDSCQSFGKRIAF